MCTETYTIGMRSWCYPVRSYSTTDQYLKLEVYAKLWKLPKKRTEHLQRRKITLEKMYVNKLHCNEIFKSVIKNHL